MADENTFFADIEEWVRETDERLLAVMRGAILDTVNDAQVPVAKGGRMRVDTGFLRSSGRASLTGFPTGQSIRPPDALPNSFSWDGQAVVSTLLRMEVGDTFYWGWTANYAEHRELWDGFLDKAVQNWSRNVQKRTEELRKEINNAGI